MKPKYPSCKKSVMVPSGEIKVQGKLRVVYVCPRCGYREVGGVVNSDE